MADIQEPNPSQSAPGPVPSEVDSRVAVVDPYGRLGTMDHLEAQDALKNGFRLASQHEVQQHQLEQKYGDGIGNSLLAAGAGAARAASFGGSDVALTKTGLVNPETLQTLKDEHSLATGVGEAAGVAGSLLAPELLGAEALTPVGAVAKAGQAVTEGALPGATRIAGALANPETSPIVHQILAKGMATGVGSAVEGAAYGLGQSVSESALGDPNLNAEKVLSNVGYSALFAGALGSAIGGAQGGKEAWVQKHLPVKAEGAELTPAEALQEHGLEPKTPLTDSEIAAKYAAPGNDQPLMRDTINLNELPAEQKEGIISGLTKIKENAPEIQDAAQKIQAPLAEGMISDSEHIQKLEDMLRQNQYTLAGRSRAEIYNSGYKRASDVVAESVGEGVDMSAAEVGNKLKDSFTDAFEAKAGPVKELYNTIGEHAPAIPIGEKSTGALSRTINKIIEDNGLIKGTPEYNFVETFANGIENVENLQQLQNFRTALGRATGKETRFVSTLVKEKLDNLEQRAIKSFAETMKTPEAKERILGLLDQISDAKSGYAALREEMGKFGKTVLGRSKIYGPQDFLDAIEEQTPEKFVKRLFAKDNSEFLGWLQKEFPEQTQLLGQYQRAAIKDAAMKNGQFVPREIFKQIDKLSPEVRGILFKPEELQRLEYARTYLDAFPKNFNPSGTSAAEGYRQAFSNPIGAVIGNARDFAALGIVKGAVKIDGNKIQGLATIERMALGAAGKIDRSAKSIFRMSGDILREESAFEAAKSVSSEVGGYRKPAKDGSDAKPDKTASLFDHLKDMASNPEKLIDSLDENTRSLYSIAPNITGGLHQAAARATQFLASKMPQGPAPKPMAPEYEPSKSEKAKFMRYYDAVEKPIRVLDQVKFGTLTSEAVEAVKTVYPQLYSQMSSALMDNLAGHMAKKNKEPLPYRIRLAMGLFLGQDLDNSTTQQAIAGNQQVLSQLGSQQARSQAQNQMRVNQTGLANIGSAQQFMTPMQVSTQRGMG